MSLFRSSLRPDAPVVDEGIERYLAALGSDLDPDPLFRRRLRGTVTNRFVAVREGLVVAPRSARGMGRLGRAVLYASFAFAASVTSVMAASQGAVPGEPLYPLKQQIEDLRVRVLPEHLRDDLAAAELRQRISEMAALSDRGEWERVTAVATVISRDYGLLLGDPRVRADGSLTVVQGLLEELPADARIAVQGVMEGLPGISQRRPPNAGPNAPATNDGANSSGTTDNVGTDSSRPAEPARGPVPNSGSSHGGGTAPPGAANPGGTNHGGQDIPVGDDEPETTPPPGRQSGANEDDERDRDGGKRPPEAGPGG